MLTSPRDDRATAGPARALTLPIFAFLAVALAGCESVGDCVQQYEFEGIVRKDGYTRAECENECDQIGRTLSCVWEGGIIAPPVIVAHQRMTGEETGQTG